MHWPHASSHLASNPSSFAVDKQWRLAATDRFEIMGAGDDGSHDEAVKLAAVEAAEMPSQPVLTLSIGAAAYDPAGGAAGLIAAADRALYVAKATGRNRVVAAAKEATRSV